MQKRLVQLFFAVMLFLGALCVRLALLTQSSGLSREAAVHNSESAVLAVSRGYVYDCRFRPLVNCDSRLAAAVKPETESLAQLPCVLGSGDRSGVFEKLSRGEIAVCAAEEAFESENIRTVRILVRYGRHSLAPHVVGYTDGDGRGVTGIEKYYDALLLRYSGRLLARCGVDALGNVLAGAPLTVVSEDYGCAGGVALTLDADVQRIAEEALNAFGVKKGAVVILDAKTSEIRAMASVPVFDRNSPQNSLDDPASPFINRAITPYSVGSVFKPVVAAAAMESGVSTGFSYRCTGKYVLNERNSFGCYRQEGHGVLDMCGGMAQSCNPYFINLALKVGAVPICSMGENLGLGQTVELADEWYAPAGLMPGAKELRSDAALCNLAFGQGTLLASPLQMAAVYAAIANGGVYRAPSLMQSIVDASGREIQRAELPHSRRVMSHETAKKLGALLRETVLNGSGRGAQPDCCAAAGKTATAQSGWLKETGEEVLHAWFCGYFPYENPRYVAAILKEDGKGGSTDCAPVFRRVAERVFSEQSASK